MLSEKDNPPSQSPPEVPITAFPGRWWLAHARARQEKALAWDILRRGGSYFLPLRKTIRRSKGRQWETALPLFAGYLFFCETMEDRLAILRTNRIVNMIEVPDQARLAAQLEEIRRMLLLGQPVDAYPHLTSGGRCRVRGGPLTGLEGQVDRRKGKVRFTVNVTILGQAASVEIDADLLESLE